MSGDELKGGMVFRMGEIERIHNAKRDNRVIVHWFNQHFEPTMYAESITASAMFIGDTLDEYLREPQWLRGAPQIVHDEAIPGLRGATGTVESGPELLSQGGVLTLLGVLWIGIACCIVDVGRKRLRRRLNALGLVATTHAA